MVHNYNTVSKHHLMACIRILSMVFWQVEICATVIVEDKSITARYVALWLNYKSRHSISGQIETLQGN